ncbi:acyl-CoA dehydrogenase [Conyzicola sp.]|uniref:acyl-CoA dehydrogenase n=1 Tax=Conyzicola sp. TaxID=1969404 RepID=UPI00398A3514
MPHLPVNHVSFRPSPRSAGPLTTLAAELAPSTVDESLDAATLLGARAHSPAAGSTTDLWEALATLAAHDLGAARTVEPHLDALAILEQASLDETPDDTATATGTWGVFAAEGGDDPLVATKVGDSWLLSGTKPWCSLAGRLDRALVSAHVGDGARRLFAVELTSPGVDVVDDAWHARGLTEIPSGPVRFDAVVGEPVGDAGWYLSRPGFAWGGIGVAACWFGGAVGIARTVFATAADDRPFAVMHLGAIDELLESARRALAEAAHLVDTGDDTIDPGVLAARVRSTVARACDEIVDRAGRALGPAPLALDAVHAKRVADLRLYVRQHHAERDQHALGSSLLRLGVAPW